MESTTDRSGLRQAITDINGIMSWWNGRCFKAYDSKRSRVNGTRVISDYKCTLCPEYSNDVLLEAVLGVLIK